MPLHMNVGLSHASPQIIVGAIGVDFYFNEIEWPIADHTTMASDAPVRVVHGQPLVPLRFESVTVIFDKMTKAFCLVMTQSNPRSF